MTVRDYRFGFSGTDLISPLQFEFDPNQKYRLPMALDHALYRLEEVQGEINDPELSAETRQKARKNRNVLNGWIRGNLQEAQNLFAEAAPRLAERLIKLGLDERVKGYTAVSAISEAFKILQTGVVDQQQREALDQVRTQIEALEEGRIIDI